MIDIRALTEMVRTIIKKEKGAFSVFVQGKFVSAETAPALSRVNIMGQEARNVRKLSHVGTLTANQSVLMVQGGGIPLTIIGVITGNIT